MKREGFISFLYPNEDKFISFYPRIRNINSDTYNNNNVDTSRLTDKTYWADWANAKEIVLDKDKKNIELYAVKQETMTMIFDCINALVKNLKMDDMYLEDLFANAGFEIPEYTGYGDSKLRFFAGNDLTIHSMYSDTFYQATQSLTGSKTGNVSSNEAKEVVNWGIGNIDKNKTTMYGWQAQVGVLLTDDKTIAYQSSLQVDSKGNIL